MSLKSEPRPSLTMVRPGPHQKKKIEIMGKKNTKGKKIGKNIIKSVKTITIHMEFFFKNKLFVLFKFLFYVIIDYQKIKMSMIYKLID